MVLQEETRVLRQSLADDGQIPETCSEPTRKIYHKLIQAT